MAATGLLLSLMLPADFDGQAEASVAPFLSADGAGVIIAGPF